MDFVWHVICSDRDLIFFPLLISYSVKITLKIARPPQHLNFNSLHPFKGSLNGRIHGVKVIRKEREMFTSRNTRSLDVLYMIHCKMFYVD